jgi:(R,R)-butanediol dehydrogenase/meso-butanediol dehydrogenase/diacetyl reductase/L-iditol 2-dehydrogenase
LHAVKQSGISIGYSSAVIGAGAIGLLVALLAGEFSGIKPVISDLNDFRVQKAIDLGAHGVFTQRGEDIHDVVMSLTDNLGVDVAFEAVGRQASLIQALELLKNGGRATLLGIFEDPKPEIPINLFVQREISLLGSQGYAWDFEDSINLVASGKIKVGELITARLPLDHLQEGFNLLNQPGNSHIKIVFNN